MSTLVSRLLDFGIMLLGEPLDFEQALWRRDENEQFPRTVRLPNYFTETGNVILNVAP